MGLWSFGRDSDIGFVTRVVSAYACDGVKLRGKLTLIFRGPRPRGIADAAADSCTVLAAQLIAEAHDHRKLIGNEAGLIAKLQQRLPEDFTPCRAIELVALHVVGGDLAAGAEGKRPGPDPGKGNAEGPGAKDEVTPRIDAGAATAGKEPASAEAARGAVPSPRAAPGSPGAGPEASGRAVQVSARIEPATSGRAAESSARAEPTSSGRGAQALPRVDPAAAPRIQPAAAPRIQPAAAPRAGGHPPRFSLQLSAAVRRRTPAPIGLPGQAAARAATSEERRSNPAQQAGEVRRDKRSASAPRAAAAAGAPAAAAPPPAPAPARGERARSDTPRNGPNSKRSTGPGSRRGSQRTATRAPALPKRAAAWQAAMAQVSESASLEDLRGPLGAMLRDGAARLALVLLLSADQPSFDLMACLDAESPAADRDDVARLAREASAAVASFFYLELLQAGLPQNFAIDALQVLGDALPGGGLPVTQMTRYLGAVDVGVELANAAATLFESPADSEAMAAAMTATIEELRVRLRQAARVVTSSAGL